MTRLRQLPESGLNLLLRRPWLNAKHLPRCCFSWLRFGDLTLQLLELQLGETVSAALGVKLSLELSHSLGDCCQFFGKHRRAS